MVIPAALFTTSRHAAQSFFPMYVRDVLTSSEALVGISMGVGALVEAPAMLLLSRLPWPPAVSLAIAGTSLLLHQVGLAVVSVAWQVPLLWPLNGIAFGFYWPSAVALVGALAPRHLRATGQSLLATFAFGLASVSGSALGGAWVERAGIGNLFYLPIGIAALATLGFLIHVRRG